MASSYLIPLLNPIGESVSAAGDDSPAVLTAFSDLEVGLKENDESGLRLTVSSELLGGIEIDRDWRVLVERAVDDRPPTLFGGRCWFIRKVRKSKRQGQRTTILEAKDQLTLLARRWIAYPEKTAYTEKEGAADDVMKEFIRENLGPDAVDPDREWPSITIADDDSLAPVVRVEAARKNLLKVLQDIVKMSEEAGTYLAFDLGYNRDSNTFTFQTYVNQRGVNRGASSGNPLVLSDQTDQLDEVEVENDWTKEASYIYEVGKGSGTARPVEVAFSTELIDASPYGRIEFIHNSSQISNPVALQDAANATLESMRSRTTVQARFVDTPDRRFGVDFEWGDVLAIEAEGFAGDCRLSAAGLKVSPGSADSIDVRLESADATA